MIYSTMQAAAPHPIPFPDYCGQFVCDRHMETQGDIGPLGLFEIENCLIGPAGMILSAEHQIFDTPYMLSRFWRDTIVKKSLAWQPNDLLGRLLSHAPDIEMRAIDDVTVVSLVKAVSPLGHGPDGARQISDRQADTGLGAEDHGDPVRPDRCGFPSL
jgi:hypothetical protein